jgi:hypothetical protein
LRCVVFLRAPHRPLHPVEDDFHGLRKSGLEFLHAVYLALGKNQFLTEQLFQDRHQLVRPLAAIAGIDAAENAHHVEGRIHLQVEQNEGEFLRPGGDGAWFSRAGSAFASGAAGQRLEPERVHAFGQLVEFRLVQPEYHPHGPRVFV